MEAMTNPHDRFFKQLLSRPEIAQDFMRYYLPAEVAELLDLSTLMLRKDSFVDEALREHFSDLLYEVDLRDGDGAYIYVLFEHKSYPERRVAFHLLRYMVQVWDRALRERQRLVPVVPVVVYHGRVRWKVSPRLSDLVETPEALAPFVPDYRYWLCDLTQYSDEDIRGGVLLRVGFLLLKYIFRDELPERYGEILSLFRELADSRTALEYLEVVLRYLSQAAEEVSAEEMKETVEEILPEGGELMTTIAQQWLEKGKQQGLQEGIQQGMQQGIQQGMYDGLLAGIELGLELRFGSEGLYLLPEIARIQDVNVLRAVHLAIKSAQSLEDLRRIYQN